MLKFRLLRTITGLPLFILGNLVVMIPYGWILWYLLGCMVSLIGGYIISRMVNYTLTGIGAALTGIPIFFLSMLPHAYLWTGFEYLTVFAIKLVMSLIGVLLIFASVNNETN